MLCKKDFYYELPSAQIAQAPAKKRGGARLLWVSERVEDRMFSDLPALIPKDAIIVLNDTKVVPVRLLGRKSTGGKVELFVLDPAFHRERTQAWCLVKANKAVRVGMTFAGTDAAEGFAWTGVVQQRAAEKVLVEFSDSIGKILQEAGTVPLPPYIERNRGPTKEDKERYQTVYAQNPGAVAAPTAGLHFTEDLLDRLREHGANIASITLHIGLGTFAPIRGQALDEHRLHREWYLIPKTTMELVTSGRPVVAVGTTVVRALESAALDWYQNGPPQGDHVAETSLFILPGFQFHVVDHLVTNFHLPESSLLMLVCALAGYEPVMKAYKHAVASGYRFYSYGDAMLLSRRRVA